MRLVIAAALSLSLATPASAQPSIDVAAPSPYIDVADERAVRYQQACTIRGEVTNKTPVPITVTLAWRAYDPGGLVLGNASVTITDLPAGGRQSFESLAFGAPTQYVPCFRITRVERYRTEVVQAVR